MPIKGALALGMAMVFSLVVKARFQASSTSQFTIRVQFTEKMEWVEILYGFQIEFAPPHLRDNVHQDDAYCCRNADGD